jgi:hypothetical protein
LCERRDPPQITVDRDEPRLQVSKLPEDTALLGSSIQHSLELRAEHPQVLREQHHVLLRAIVEVESQARQPALSRSHYGLVRLVSVPKQLIELKDRAQNGGSGLEYRPTLGTGCRLAIGDHRGCPPPNLDANTGDSSTSLAFLRPSQQTPRQTTGFRPPGVESPRM